MPHSDELDRQQVLAVRNLNVAFPDERQPIPAVKNLSFSLKRGETLAIVGESGSGKSVTALSLMRLIEQSGGLVACDSLLLRRRNGQVSDLTTLSSSQVRSVRGADIAMIFQEPMTSLNPVFPVGEQIAESIRLHQGLSGDEALAEARRMLEQVRIPEADAILGRYPHQLSGGMRQRVMIAMALSCRPAVLIADEPTTALDVTIQAQILQLIKVLQDEMEMGVIFITHDMGVVADIADRVLVMYQGEAVETGTVEQIFHAPEHPYTRALLAAVPRLGAMNGSDLPRRFPLISLTNPGFQEAETEQDTVVPGDPILQVRDLVTRFPLRGGLLNRVKREVHAVENVSFDLWPGETLSLVGESGSGKSTTLAAMVDFLNHHSDGHILTLEDPVEFIHQSKRCLVQQREIGLHCNAFADALRAALREDPDVILLGELRDSETIRLALTAAETGHLVLATLHTRGAAQAIERLVDAFPAEEKEPVRKQLAGSLQAVLAQKLERDNKQGRVALFELLINTPAAANLIREGKTYQLPGVIQTGLQAGMQNFEQSRAERKAQGRL